MAKEGDGILEDTLSYALTLSPTHNKMVIGSIRVLCQTSATKTPISTYSLTPNLHTRGLMWRGTCV